jgi:hypothetical protein
MVQMKAVMTAGKMENHSEMSMDRLMAEKMAIMMVVYLAISSAESMDD